MIKTAIVGMGRWGQRLVNSVQTSGKPHGALLHFTAGTTGSLQKAKPFADEQKLQLFESYEDLIDAGLVDAVVIASPHSRHPNHVRLALEAGLHVFVEKPLALDADTAKDLVQLSESTDRVLAVGFNRRFLPAYQKMKHIVESGTIGRPLHIEGNFSGPFGHTYTNGVWHAQSSETPAGGLTLMGVHTIDCMIGLLGNVTAVRARSRRQYLKVDIDDTTDVSLDFANGTTGYVSTLTATASHWRLQLFGTEGWAQMTDQQHLAVCDASGKRQEEFPAINAERDELQEFAKAIKDRNHPYPVPLPDVTAGIEVLNATVQSLKNDGSPIPIGLPAPPEFAQVGPGSHAGS
ncbi:oxidoreductase [Arthrobacter sp. MYb23]|uniref:Gfo/Idh/MocA family protein n=1 Tax=unclassified Arthrobacter TaxID=235627 RepID=UPI000CFC7148|nr:MULTISPECIES: Gfo/Idh/MocA family oxidoreductase [unclassified Arthrobacter]PRB43045.1 oxidoreductase [Arthrobacter sp. MYb51]PRB97997.1 oxidoreductase [Arthrobacter sp. MYb23]